jgi:hypothetical protein
MIEYVEGKAADISANIQVRRTNVELERLFWMRGRRGRVK